MSNAKWYQVRIPALFCNEAEAQKVADIFNRAASIENTSPAVVEELPVFVLLKPKRDDGDFAADAPPHVLANRRRF